MRYEGQSMSTSKISFFLPMRSGSQRVIDKNTRPFSITGKSLFELKIEQLIKLQHAVEEIIISTNDPQVILQSVKYQDCSKIRVELRPEHLCLSTTKVQDLIDYVPTVVKAEHVFWLHVTAPFVDYKDYQNALEEYQKYVIDGEYDSLMSVNKIQQFIWDDQQKTIINCDRSVNPWPNTQDLNPLYEVNHAFYVSSVYNYKKFRDRIGINPKLFPLEGIKKIDIDWEADFLLAQKIESVANQFN